MPRKVILIADPGIDTAFAIALAMTDPNLDVVGLIPTAGNVPAARASSNVQLLIDKFDPPKWPRTASPLGVKYEIDGTALHGPDGLGGVNLPISDRHQHQPADKVLVELVHEHPRQLTIINLGPATTLATAFRRDPELPNYVERLVLVGGVWKDPGNAGPVSEFHFALDPFSARELIQAACHTTIIPLDVTRRLVLPPAELLHLPNAESKTCRFLREIIPYGIRASSHMYGIEGFHLKDVLGIAHVALPGCLTCESRAADIETVGELTRGMMVVDTRKTSRVEPNVHIAVEAAIGEIRQYVSRTLSVAR